MYKIETISKKILADTTTPVSIYLRLRDLYPNSILLESSDYHSKENSLSYICCKPIAGIKLNNNTLCSYFPDGATESLNHFNISESIQLFKDKFQVEETTTPNLQNNGLFGYFNWNILKFTEDVNIDISNNTIPIMQYHLYAFVIVVDHFKNELRVFQNRSNSDEKDELNDIINLIQDRSYSNFKFSVVGSEESDMDDEDFKKLVLKMKAHISRGDVFQIVPSISFSQSFKGDEFNVYRCLRSINPSPYLFYFDYGDFKLFGSSPEAQISIKNKEANLFPIAGTFKRTGNDKEDAIMAEKLLNDEKESAEHVMLVDLARNDLSRNCFNVEVKSFKKIQFYSHLIHLVSHISGELNPEAKIFDVVTQSYPAGTLSGAPKLKAIELLNKYEKTNRRFYAGAIGFMGFNDEFLHAIMIRTFMSKENKLHYRAGAGIVFQSNPESELAEVNNKIAALRKAIKMATNL